MGLIRLLVTLRAVRDRAGRGARQSRRQRHRPGRRPRRRRHRDRPRRAGHLRRSVRGARDHLRPPVPRGDAITFDTISGHGRVDRAEIDAHPRHHRRSADHRQQATARQGDLKTLSARSAASSSRSASPTRPRRTRCARIPAHAEGHRRGRRRQVRPRRLRAFGAPASTSTSSSTFPATTGPPPTRARPDHGRHHAPLRRGGHRHPLSRPRPPTPPRPTARWSCLMRSQDGKASNDDAAPSQAVVRAHVDGTPGKRGLNRLSIRRTAPDIALNAPAIRPIAIPCRTRAAARASPQSWRRDLLDAETDDARRPSSPSRRYPRLSSAYRSSRQVNGAHLAEDPAVGAARPADAACPHSSSMPQPPSGRQTRSSSLRRTSRTVASSGTCARVQRAIADGRYRIRFDHRTERHAAGRRCIAGSAGRRAPRGDGDVVGAVPCRPPASSTTIACCSKSSISRCRQCIDPEQSCAPTSRSSIPASRSPRPRCARSRSIRTVSVRLAGHVVSPPAPRRQSQHRRRVAARSRCDRRRCRRSSVGPVVAITVPSSVLQLPSLDAAPVISSNR